MSFTMYSTPWCGYCSRLKSQLTREGITFTEVDIEQDPTAADYVMSVNGATRPCRPWSSPTAVPRRTRA